MSSLKGIRSRLRYTSSTAAGDSDQGSPSRTSSFFQQFASFLVPEDAAGIASNNRAPFSLEENGSGIEDDRHTEEEFLSFVMDSGEDSSTAAMGNGPFLENRSEQIINSPGRPTSTMSAIISHRLPSLLAASFSRESLDLGSDRDTSREGSVTGCNEEPSANIAHSLERPNRRHHRFANRDKRRSERERSKSIERSGTAAAATVVASGTEETAIKSKNDYLGPSNKGSRSNTASPSRLPHRRIAAWAREIVDDFHAIEEAHKGKRLTESGDDPGETLAIKRCLS